MHVRTTHFSIYAFHFFPVFSYSFSWDSFPCLPLSPLALIFSASFSTTYSYSDIGRFPCRNTKTADNATKPMSKRARESSLPLLFFTSSPSAGLKKLMPCKKQKSMLLKSNFTHKLTLRPHCHSSWAWQLKASELADGSADNRSRWAWHSGRDIALCTEWERVGWDLQVFSQPLDF